jgi:hypothetical protein
MNDQIDSTIDLDDADFVQPTISYTRLGGIDSLTSSQLSTITLDPSGLNNLYTGQGATVGYTGGSGLTTCNTISTGTTYSINTSGINCHTNWNAGGYQYNSTVTPNTVSINTDGITMQTGTDITLGGKSLKDFMAKMEERLAILVPDPKKLEKFEALKKAYEHYKTMESLCFDEPEEEK